MKIGIVSDIHSSPAALQAALDRLDRAAVDEVWCAGDIVLQYRFCPRTVGLLRARGARAIQGNHDAVFLSSAGTPARSRLPHDDDLGWLGSLPRTLSDRIMGVQLVMVHGSPWPPYNDYLRAGDPRWSDVGELGADVLIAGHTHEPMIERYGRTLVINPGSVGEPRQRPLPVGTYAILELPARSAQIHELA
jgi:putative phosphoesterase